ncbi:MAG: PHP domain-containing protein [Clostridia bacterium]|nr:PHP domain-containing protein [Clostridia bacterium]
MNCDLHTHTNHSDGSSTVAELVSGAKERELIIALTDHNTVTGLPEFLSEADRLGVVAIGGTELSTVYEGREFHLIGLFIDPEHYEKIEALCREYHMLKEQSNIDLVAKLCNAGYIIDYSAIKAKNLKGNVNRAHIAAELIKQGYVSSISEAFDKLLDEKRGLYIPPRRLELVDAIGFLRGIRAVPILAHPLKEIDDARLRQMLPVLKEAGLVAIETMHSSYSDDKIAISKKIADEFGLLESGGSDYHGSIKPGVMLGVGKGNLDIPDTVYHALVEKRKTI